MPPNFATSEWLTQIIFPKIIGDLDGARQLLGSRYSDGNVPNVDWNRDNRKVYVNWYNPQNRNANLRCRVEVSALRSPHGSFCVYLIQPFSILEISCSCFCRARYVPTSIISASFPRRINCLIVSTLIRVLSSIGSLLVFSDNPASIKRVKTSKVVISTLAHRPNRSCFGNFLPI